MKIAITGASGLVGTALIQDLTANGHQVLRLVRTDPKAPDEVRWDIRRGEIDADRLEGIDAAINLAGENVGEGRWTDEKKRSIRESRVRGTELLVKAVTGLKQPPRVLISTSATGIYGERGSEVVDETSAPGTTFLADVCREWEAAAEPAVAAGIRVVTPRIGVVLSREGGALPKLLTPFRFGLGGKIGSGDQYMSWLTMRDLVSFLRIALDDVRYTGPINVVTPEPVTNAEFTRALGKKVSRPTFFTVPEFALKLVFGDEMASETVLSSCRVDPRRLRDLGFSFADPTLDQALTTLLK